MPKRMRDIKLEGEELLQARVAALENEIKIKESGLIALQQLNNALRADIRYASLGDNE
jgi:hypothetical protein